MKKITILFIFILSIKTYCQTEFKYDTNGLSSEYLVINIDSLDASQIYSKTIDWIKDSYKNPEKVIKAKFENEKIRFEGLKKSGLSTKILGLTNFYDVRYTIEISFKDGKFKFQPTNLEQYVPSSNYSKGGWSKVPLNNGKWAFKKNGKLRKISKKQPSQIENIFNHLSLSLKVYLLKENNTIKDKKDDW